MIIIIILLLIFGIKQQIDINSLNAEIADLEKQLSDIQYENEKKQNEIDMPIEDSIEKYAKEDGFKDPNAQYFYNDFSG
jgi:cell division protein FtsL